MVDVNTSDFTVCDDARLYTLSGVHSTNRFIILDSGILATFPVCHFPRFTSLQLNVFCEFTRNPWNCTTWVTSQATFNVETKPKQHTKHTLGTYPRSATNFRWKDETHTYIHTRTRAHTHIIIQHTSVQNTKQNETGKHETNAGLYTIIVNIKLKYWPINAVFNACPPVYLMFTFYSHTNRKIHSRGNSRAFMILYYPAQRLILTSNFICDILAGPSLARGIIKLSNLQINAFF
mgnify:CR=1 FL=1